MRFRFRPTLPIPVRVPADGGLIAPVRDALVLQTDADVRMSRDTARHVTVSCETDVWPAVLAEPGSTDEWMDWREQPQTEPAAASESQGSCPTGDMATAPLVPTASCSSSPASGRRTAAQRPGPVALATARRRNIPGQDCREQLTAREVRLQRRKARDEEGNADQRPPTGGVPHCHR